MRRFGVTGRGLVVALPYLWLLLFFVVPFVIVLKISFSDIDLAIPPYKPLLEWVGKNSLAIKLNFNNYAFLFTDRLYINAFLNSIKVAFISTVLCLLIGYPMAYGIARAKPTTRNMLLLLVILPFWTSLLLRVYAWIGLLKANGVINNVLLALGRHPRAPDHAVHAVRHVRRHRVLLPAVPHSAAVREPRKNGLAAARSRGGSGLPPLAGVLQDHACRCRATASWPAPCWCSFRRWASSSSRRCSAVPNALMIGRVLWDEFFSNRAWPVASAVAILLLILLVPFMMWYQSVQARESAGAR